ncbi:unnamed protein product [Lepeophtheirus salmonis]|uniref:RNA-directed DNA polymerase n=1 Tax=Lepeophtheirus salmonis TaxID=72036 RepID=A0A7R8D6F6_LEPSM|nr:unnamed protein product [Lepeophtheirus salmonis]CAF3043495.1 unnamed protein product [Lepeophtheirus salmonis]
MAHALSRSPVDKPTQGDDGFTQDMYGSIHTITANLLDTLNNSDISQFECDPITLESIARDPILEEIAEASRNDPIFRLLKDNILGKMDKHNINPNHHPTIETGSNPPTTTLQSSGDRKDIKTGSPKLFFWPGITADIRNIIKACEECQTRRSSLPKEPLKSHPAPRDVFQEIATDFFGVRGKHYLAIVDRYSNFLFVPKFSSAPTSKSLISSLLHHIATFAESSVKSIKALLLKTGNTESEAFQEELLELRNTPLRHGSLSPSQIVLGRPMRSRLHAHNLSLAEDWQERLNEHDRHIAKQHEYAKNHYNKTSNELNPILIGSKVWIQDPTSKIWDQTATVQGKKQDREYLLLLPSGKTLCRNRRFIRILRTREDIITTPQCESTLKYNSQTDEPSNLQRLKRLRFAPIKFTNSD